ncbi:uncharacterized protein EV154DRAFT_569457 [Mucor mucedo]|uniref:uncharacterized protein n=1 Tax=Mucor mucedo TaxID=29922 RepID=UPI00221FC349|nr:uncharacterized protein EV154DRAFT_569457 [Mucor mucedo]KAI7875640.1 hypothetical protein EV154DRAFT_569457 [Mucor mucedo]
MSTSPKFEASGSAASKFATTVASVSMEVDHHMNTPTPAFSTAGPMVEVTSGAIKVAGAKRSVLVASSEDLFHFVVGCFHKWQYWWKVISLLNIGDTFETEFDSWSGFVSLCGQTQKPLSSDMLVIIGSGLATLWKYHWRCVVDGDLWNSEAALNMFQQDHAILIADTLETQSPLVCSDSLMTRLG